MSYEGNLNLAERVRELEREVEALRETLGELQGELRGVNEWVADTAQVVALADSTGCVDTTCQASGVCVHGGWVE